MSVYLFGGGSGKLPARKRAALDRIAKKHDVSLNVMTGEQGHCRCGGGCLIDQCDQKRWWFEGPNHGEPFDSQLAARVQDDIDLVFGKDK